MTPFAPHRSAVRVGQAEPEPAELRFVDVRPDEVLLPGEEFLVLVNSPRGAARDLLLAVADLAGAMQLTPRSVSDEGAGGAQAFAAVLGLRGSVVAEALNAAGGPGDEWGIVRANYARVFGLIPEMAREAAESAADGMLAAQAYLAEKAAEWARRIAAGVGKGLGAGTIALALGAAAAGLFIYSKARS
ncbi:MAG: hypothetical protein EHM88_06530 [Candidatus Rokuibacteriota bacterium]|nr:MAG: hypothetical protein EHM88_06530 [Candidatus Rokubacteria bacterium]